MDIVVVDQHEDIGVLAADIITEVIVEKPTAVVGLATGSSPLSTYAELARRVREKNLDFSRARAFALDEYVGLSAHHPQSYAEVLRSAVVEPLRFDPRSVLVPDGLSGDAENSAADYDAAIARAGGIDIQILGIGSNGHLGFNEPGSALDSRTRVAELTTATRRDNSRFFTSLADVPTHCITQGLGTILQARRLILVAQGSAKAIAVARALRGPVASTCPASVLQRHPDVTVILDRAASAALSAAGSPGLV